MKNFFLFIQFKIFSFLSEENLTYSAEVKASELFISASLFLFLFCFYFCFIFLFLFLCFFFSVSFSAIVSFFLFLFCYCFFFSVSFSAIVSFSMFHFRQKLMRKPHKKRISLLPLFTFTKPAFHLDKL